MGDEKSREGEVLATLRGTTGFRDSSCVSCAFRVSATVVVSGCSGTRAACALNESGAVSSNSLARATPGFRTFKGLSDGWSLNGLIISVRPLARLQGSRGLVSTGAGLVPYRFARSARDWFLLEFEFFAVTDTS